MCDPLQFTCKKRLLLAVLAVILSCSSSPADTVYRPMTAQELEQQLAAAKECAGKLARIMRAAELFAMDNADQPPPGLYVLTNELETPSALFCPASFREAIPTNWTELDWASVDYKWIDRVDWSNPTNAACYCTVHNNIGYVDGGVARGQGCRSGWPLLTASPMDLFATPGENAHLDMELAPDVALPVAYQWRRSYQDYATNVFSYRDNDDPRVLRWATNIITIYVGTNLPSQTNSQLLFSALQTIDSGFYSLAVSNILGVSHSRQIRVDVSAFHAGITTNASWSDALCTNNLRQLWLFGKIWAASHNNLLPHYFAEMTNSWSQPIFGWPQALFCRADTNQLAPDTWSQVDFGNTSYEMPVGDWLNPYDVFCRCRVHGYYISVDGTTMHAPLLNNIRSLAGGSVEVNFRTFAARENVLECSEDLEHWNQLWSWGPEAADIRFTDFVTEKRRFYRLRLL